MNTTEVIDRYVCPCPDGCNGCEVPDFAIKEIERLKARVAELESALRGYVKATTGQESATVTFPMALEGEVK